MPTPIEFELLDADPTEVPRQPLLDQLETLGNRVTHFVTTRPLVAVGIVLTAGFLLGRMARR